MKLCPSCGEAVGEHLPLCPRCRASVAGVPPVVRSQAGGSVEPGTKGRGASATCHEPGCGADIPDGAEKCLRCGSNVADCMTEATDFSITLSVEGDSVTLPTGTTPIGREGPLTRLLRRWPNVSRRHAEITVDGPEPGARIIDCNSTNGTFVDGRRLAAGEQVPLRSGSEIRLARDVTIVVESGPDGA